MLQYIIETKNRDFQRDLREALCIFNFSFYRNNRKNKSKVDTISFRISVEASETKLDLTFWHDEVRWRICKSKMNTGQATSMSRREVFYFPLALNVHLPKNNILLNFSEELLMIDSHFFFVLQHQLMVL